ncbi:MAG: SIS domain-containing protein [Ilumatobacteraceae bacterium]
MIGQGTAAVAGQSAAAVLDELAAGELDIDPITATELSGFALRADMSDTLIIAVSQSGTTTDTNRTVDLARSRGALVIGIVNRRGSDLTDKADGVLYTSDGRVTSRCRYTTARSTLRSRRRPAGVWITEAADRAIAVATNCRRPPRELPDAMRAGDRPAGHDRRGRPLRSRCTSGTGPWSATVRTRWPPRRCGSSCPGALLQVDRL